MGHYSGVLKQKQAINYEGSPESIWLHGVENNMSGSSLKRNAAVKSLQR